MPKLNWDPIKKEKWLWGRWSQHLPRGPKVWIWVLGRGEGTSIQGWKSRRQQSRKVKKMLGPEAQGGERKSCRKLQREKNQVDHTFWLCWMCCVTGKRKTQNWNCIQTATCFGFEMSHVYASSSCFYLWLFGSPSLHILSCALIKTCSRSLTPYFQLLLFC